MTFSSRYLRGCGFLFVLYSALLSTLVSCAYLKVIPGSRLWIGCALLVLGSMLSGRAVAAFERALCLSDEAESGSEATPR